MDNYSVICANSNRIISFNLINTVGALYFEHVFYDYVILKSKWSAFVCWFVFISQCFREPQRFTVSWSLCLRVVVQWAVTVTCRYSEHWFSALATTSIQSLLSICWLFNKHLLHFGALAVFGRRAVFVPKSQFNLFH